jgi:hypothetical protein
LIWAVFSIVPLTDTIIHTVNILRRPVRGTILSAAHIKYYTVIHTVNIFRRIWAVLRIVPFAVLLKILTVSITV